MTQFSSRLDQQFNLRISTAEKINFERAAALAGLPLSTWMRIQLRSCAEREFENDNLSNRRRES